MQEENREEFLCDTSIQKTCSSKSKRISYQHFDIFDSQLFVNRRYEFDIFIMVRRNKSNTEQLLGRRTSWDPIPSSAKVEHFEPR